MGLVFSLANKDTVRPKINVCAPLHIQPPIATGFYTPTSQSTPLSVD